MFGLTQFSTLGHGYINTSALVFLSAFMVICSMLSKTAAANELPDYSGNIKYSIYDTATHRLLTKGVREKVLHKADFRISPATKFLYIKRINLDDHFIFGLADDVRGSSDRVLRRVDGKQVDDDGYVVSQQSDDPKENYGGFGLFGERDDVRTFSWDWFEFDRPSHAIKLQESGALSVESKTTPMGTEIGRMKFLEDVSIRIDRWGQRDPVEPAWRIKILKGSVINWPPVDVKVEPR